MKKIVKETGNSLGIYFNKEECEAYGIKKGDIIEFELEVKNNGTDKK